MKLLSVILCILIFMLQGWSLALGAQAPVGATTPAGVRSGESTELKSLLLKIFLSSARVKDLLSQTHPENMKMSAKDLSTYQQTAESVDEQLQTLEKWRYQFLYHPENSEDGKNTLNSLADVIPPIQDIAAMIGENEGGAAAEPLRSAAAEFKELKRSLEADLKAQFPSLFPAQVAQQAAPARPQVEAATAKAAQPAQPAPAAVPAQALQPEQVKALLQKVFLASARINDLLSVAQPEKWKMTDSERAIFNDRVQTIDLQLKTLEKWRYASFYHPDNADDAQGTVQSINTLVPEIEGITSTIGKYQGASSAAQFGQAAKDLASAGDSLNPYVAYLREKRQQQLAAQAAALQGPKGLSVERITPRAVPPPLTTPVAVITPPLTANQVKAILFKIYTSYFRINDLLSQERPEQWKTSPAERTLVGGAREALFSKLRNLEKWRALFSQSPGNVYYGFETYVAVNDLLHPLRMFSREISRDENARLGDDYSRRAADLEAQLQNLVPYFRFILKNDEAGYGQYQADLANCQNELGYAMHGFVRPATSMKNVVPDFEGRRARRESRDKDHQPGERR